jgi:hypothetical protein
MARIGRKGMNINEAIEQLKYYQNKLYVPTVRKVCDIALETIEALQQELAKAKADGRLGDGREEMVSYWYCPNCKIELDGCHVTYEEKCEYCGSDVLSVPETISQEELDELIKAKADGRLKILPAKPGDIIYRPEALQFCWVITKVEIYEDEIVFIDDSDNIFRPDDIDKTVFPTREAAEKAKQNKLLF